MTDTAFDDTIVIEGGHILTPDFEVREADVLIDRPAGVVLDVDDDLDGDERLDATDSLVMPGLVNAHTHVAMTLLRGYADDKPLDAWLQEDIWPVEAELTPADIRVGTDAVGGRSIRTELELPTDPKEDERGSRDDEQPV